MEQIDNLKELINQGDVDTAIKQLDQLLQDSSVEKEKDTLYYLRGNAYRKKGDWKQALDYDTLAYRSKNIYVGDIEKAEKVICTYYDTPVHALGSYFMFDWKDQRKKTIYSILLSFILLFSLGWWGMMIYNKNPHHVFDLLSV